MRRSLKRCCAWAAACAALFILAEAQGAEPGSLKVSFHPPREVVACIQALEGSPGRVHEIEKIPSFTVPEFWRDLKAGKVSVGVSDSRPEGPFRMLGEPLAFRDPAHFRSFARSRLFRTMAASQAEWDGIFPVAAAYAGQHALLSRKEISSVDDFKEMRIRSFSKTLFLGLGAKVVSLPLGEVKTALDRSAVDAAEFLPAVISLLQLSGSARNLYLTGFVTDVVLFSVQSKAWGALPPERRRELAGWLSGAAEACSRANYDAESQALKELEAKGVRILPFDAAKVRARLPPPKGGPGWTAEMWNELQALK